jgi:hypothetical protein
MDSIAKAHAKHMGLSLTDMPLEIRRNIYANLLLDQNVSRFDAKGYVSPHFETSLFTVNKEISAESLQFFYTENAFISFEVRVPLKVDKLHRTGFKLLPESRVRCCRNFIVKFQLQRVPKEYTGNSAGYEIVPSMFAIFAARQLPLFMMLVNHSNIHSWNMGFVPEVKLVFRAGRGYFKNQDQTLAMLVNSFKRLRGNLDPNARISGVGPTQNMSLTIHGRRDLGPFDEIKPAVLSRASILIDIFADASSAMRRAGSLAKNGNHMEAIRCYCIVLCVLKLSSPVSRLFSRAQRKAVRFYYLRANIQMCLLHSKLGQYNTATNLPWMLGNCFRQAMG